MTAILVAAMFLGGAASAGIARNTTMTETINSIQTPTTINVGAIDGLAPNTGLQPSEPGTQTGEIKGLPFYVCNAYTSPYNIYTFTPAAPASMVLLGSHGLGTYINGATFDNDGVLWVCAYGGNIYKMNPANAAVTLVGAAGQNLNGITCDPRTNLLYAVTSTSLWSVNKLTGAITQIGAAGVGTWIDIACDKLGNAYVNTVSSTAITNLYKVNLATGVFTLIGSNGVQFCYAQDSCFDIDAGILYHTGYIYSAGTSGLYRINTTTGAATLIGQIAASGWEPDGFAIPYAVKPLDHDVSVVSVDAPVAGTAAASYIPKATVKNVGNNTESFNVSCKIMTEGLNQVRLWNESFENWVPMNNKTVFPPAGWGIQNQNGYGTWLRDGSVVNSHSGFNNTYIRNDTTQNSDVLIAKPVYIAANGTQFSFWYKVWLNGAPETFKVGYNTTTDPWVWFDTVNTNVGNKWTQYVWNTPSSLTGKTVYFGVNYTSFDWYGLRLDDFVLADGTTESFECTPGYFTNATTGINWNSEYVSGKSLQNYWRKATTGDVINSPDRIPQQGIKMAWYKIYSNICGFGNVSRLYMTQPLNLSAFGKEILFFNFYMYQSTSGSSYQDKCSLEISIDNGKTWTPLGEWRQYGTTAGWMLRSVSLLGYEYEKSVLFSFKATSGSYLGYDITIDNVNISYIPTTILYSDVKPVTNLPKDTSIQVSFNSWTDPGWQSLLPAYNNTNVKYDVKVLAILPTDQKASNNLKVAQPLLYYPFYHDVGVTAIVSPATGPGAPSIPVSYTVKNFGQFPENGLLAWFFTNISIYDLPGVNAISKDFSDSVYSKEDFGKGWYQKRVTGTSTVNWSVVTSSPSYPPVTVAKEGARMAWYNAYSISTGSDRLYSETPIDLSGKNDFRLKFWMYETTQYPTYHGQCYWEYSLDNGVTWTVFPGGQFSPNAADMGFTTSQWVEWKVDMTPIFNKSNVMIGFRAVSDYYNGVVIDDVRLYYMSNASVFYQQNFETYYPRGFTFGPDPWTKEQQDPWQTWKVGGTTPATFYAMCTEVGSKGAQNESLITSKFSTGAQAWVKFDRTLYLSGTIDSKLEVYYTLDNGSSWTLITSWIVNTPAGNFEQAVPGMNSKPYVQLKFKFVSGGELPTASKADYAYIDNLIVSDKATVPEYMVPYVPPVALNPGDSVTVTPLNWIPAAQPSGPHNYKAIANTFLSTDNNLANNQFVKTFVLTTGHDLSVQAITQPAARVLWLGPGAHPVAATIKNLGTFIESATATATIRYTGNSSIIYTSTFAITSLAPGAEVTATFAAFTPAVSDDFTLRVEIPADDNNANNFKELAFSTDVTPPTSSCSLTPATPNGENNWYVSDVTVTLTAVDPDSGVAVIKYKIDGAGGWTEYAGAFPISEGSHTVTYYAIDNLGNAEGPHTTATIKIDKTKPTITLTVTDQGGKKKWLLEATVSDVTSGVAKVEFYIAGVLKATVTATPWQYTYTGTDGPAKAIVFDAAGNFADSGDVASFTSVVSNLQQQTKLQPRTL